MKQYGKNAQPIGETPSIILINPKFSHNVGAAVRAASCFGIQQVWYTGDRMKLDERKRLPREERMKGYQDVDLIQFDYPGYRGVDLIQFDYPFDAFAGGVPVAIELRNNSEYLTEFEHPENALYVFGPEDGSIGKPILRHCHRFVVIPTRHCTNLAAAVYIVLYDRLVKSGARLELAENRGFIS